MMQPSTPLLDRRDSAPPLPGARGELSDWVLAKLGGHPAGRAIPDPAGADPLGADLQMALLVCYELHYRGFRGVDDGWEWDPALLEFRSGLERAFLARLRGPATGGAADATGHAETVQDAETVLDQITAPRPDARGPVDHLAAGGSWEQMREYFIHRSVYQLKEADPYVWAIPRLRGQAKASLAAVEFDEFGAGHGTQVHSRLFADLLDAAGLDSAYLAYADRAPAPTLAVSNLATTFGLHRALRGALVGHFAVTEGSTGPAAKTLERALTGMAAPDPCVRFYTEHIEADAVHEQVVRHDILRPLLEAEPWLTADVVFGMRAVAMLEADLAAMLLDRWDHGRNSLV
nr:iron-containing redox enzyme family protein [Tomitella gaofuii]